ncbi:threonine synthase [bacterium]|nr:threonine synthase [bacterium]MBU3955042.1 threonine synthase [bacterium]MBU4134114.1 threonine synthase [bacterium]
MKGIIAKYRKYLPVTDKTPVISLQEGGTPLIRVSRIEKEFGFPFQLYVKYEGLNPTGSFKDRGMTLAISKAVEKGCEYVICASTGNTSASAAAYSARAGMKALVVIPEGAIALGKLSQAMIHGAKIVAVKGNFDDSLKIVLAICEKYPVELVNSINPFRIEGQKTAAFEIIDDLGRAPDYHAIPVGNAGNITAYWKGYKEYSAIRPVMLGFQAAKSAPIVDGHIIKNPQTIATAIKIGNPASWKKAEEARDESAGAIDKVTDDEIIFAYKALAGLEGIFCEPASAAGIAGLIKYNKKGYFKNASERTIIAATLTGHGLKDTDTAIKSCDHPVVVEPVIEEVCKILGLE